MLNQIIHKSRVSLYFDNDTLWVMSFHFMCLISLIVLDILYSMVSWFFYWTGFVISFWLFKYQLYIIPIFLLNYFIPCFSKFFCLLFFFLLKEKLLFFVHLIAFKWFCLALNFVILQKFLMIITATKVYFSQQNVFLEELNGWKMGNIPNFLGS